MRKGVMMAGLLSALALGATAALADEKGNDVIASMIAEKLGSLGFEKGSFSVHRLEEFNGLYEVVNRQGMVFITDSNARYFIAGHVVDPVNRVDLSQARVNASRVGALKEAVASGKLFVTGDRRAKDAVVIFDDPDCPYCAKLESQLDARSGVKAYHVMTPLVQLHPQAREHATMVLCSGNPGRKLKEIMARHATGAPVETRISSYCRKKADRVWPVHEKLARDYGVNGTPFLVRLKDGAVWQGYMPLAFLKRWAHGEQIDPMQVNAAIQQGL